MISMIEGVLAVFVFGTWVFWAGIISLCCAMLFFLEYQEDGFRSTLVFVGILAYLQFAAKLPFFQLIRDHPFWTIGGYLLGGITYGFFRWAWHCSKFRGRYNEVKAAFAAEHKLETNFDPSQLPGDTYEHEEIHTPRSGFARDRDQDDRRQVRKEGLRAKWLNALERGKASKLPVARTSKALITLWMTYWPWSLLWTTIQDFVVKLWEHIYTFLSKAFQSVANRVIGNDIQKDFAS